MIVITNQQTSEKNMPKQNPTKIPMSMSYTTKAAMKSTNSLSSFVIYLPILYPISIS